VEVVGRPRLRLMFSLLKVGRAAPFAELPFGDVVVVEAAGLLLVGARNLPRTGAAFAEFALSFCTVSSSTGL